MQIDFIPENKKNHGFHKVIKQQNLASKYSNSSCSSTKKKILLLK